MQETWQDGIYGALKAVGVRQIGYVPDAGHIRLIERAHADNDMTAVVLTTEEEGIAQRVERLRVRRIRHDDSCCGSKRLGERGRD